MHVYMCVCMYVLYVYCLDINFLLIKIFLIKFLKKFFLFYPSLQGFLYSMVPLFRFHTPFCIHCF